MYPHQREISPESSPQSACCNAATIGLTAFRFQSIFSVDRSIRRCPKHSRENKAIDRRYRHLQEDYESSTGEWNCIALPELPIGNAPALFPLILQDPLDATAYPGNIGNRIFPLKRARC